MSKIKTFLNQLFIGFAMFGTLVGAGFASGKEVWVYFAQFGNSAYIVIFLTGLMFFGASYLFFKLGKNFQISTVQNCNSVLLGKFASVGEIILVFSNLVLLASMFAGADSLFGIFLPDLPYRFPAVITGIIVFVVVCFGFKKVAKCNVLVVPLLLLVVTVVLIVSLVGGNAVFNGNEMSFGSFFSGLFYAVLFVGSNMFLSGFIFSKLGKDYSDKEILGGSLIGSIFLTLSLVGMTMVLFSNPTLVNSDMPVVSIALSINNVFAYMVLLIVWFGLLTTSFALLYTVSNWLKTYFGSTVIVTLLASIVALLMSGIGFSYFVQFVYPAMGVFGLVYIILAVIAMKKSKSSKNKIP